MRVLGRFSLLKLSDMGSCYKDVSYEGIKLLVLLK